MTRSSLVADLLKIGHVIVFEYRKLVFTRRFVLSVLGLPLVIGLVFVVGALIGGMESSTVPIAYVDPANILVQMPSERMPTRSPGETVEIWRLDDLESAQLALGTGEIQGYYVVAPDYFTSGDVRLIYIDQGSRPAWPSALSGTFSRPICCEICPLTRLAA